MFFNTVSQNNLVAFPKGRKESILIDLIFTTLKSKHNGEKTQLNINLIPKKYIYCL